MKRIVLCVIITLSVISLSSSIFRKVDFKVIKKEKLSQVYQEPKSSYPLNITIENIYGKEVVINNMDVFTKFLAWKENGNIIAQYPQMEYEGDVPMKDFYQAVYSTISKLWIIPYKFEYSDTYEGPAETNGILFMSKDGKSIIKDLKLPDCELNSFIFNKGTIINDDFHISHTDSDIFFTSPYFISVYGDITYTFPIDFDMKEVSFSKNGDYFGFCDNNSDIRYIYSVHNSDMLYKGLEYRTEYFSISNDFSYCGTVNQRNGQISIYKMDIVSKKAIKYNSFFVGRIAGVPYSYQNIYDGNGNVDHIIYNIKIRFEDGTNNLIITSDDQYETVVEVIFED